MISIVALAGILAAMANIYIWRKAKKRKDSNRTQLSEKISQLLMVTVVLEPSTKLNNSLQLDTAPFLKFRLNDKVARELLVCELINYRNYFSGSIAERIRQLYLDLSLDTEAKKKLLTKDREAQAIALSELFKMDVDVDQAFLLTLLHDKNRYVRDFARLLLIKFTKGDPLDLLREITEPLTQWEAFEIFLLFQQKKDYRLSPMEGLIDPGKESSVVSICLKLAVHFKNLAAVPLIIATIQTADLKLRAEAIISLGKLEAVNTTDYLISIYKLQPQETRLAILTALGMMRNSKSLEFLEAEFIASTDFEIKKQASDAIIKQHPLSKETIDKLMHKAEALEHRIMSHSLNPLINAV